MERRLFGSGRQAGHPAVGQERSIRMNRPVKGARRLPANAAVGPGSRRDQNSRSASVTTDQAAARFRLDSRDRDVVWKAEDRRTLYIGNPAGLSASSHHLYARFGPGYGIEGSESSRAGFCRGVSTMSGSARVVPTGARALVRLACPDGVDRIVMPDIRVVPCTADNQKPCADEDDKQARSPSDQATHCKIPLILRLG